jgi:predicted permease
MAFPHLLQDLRYTVRTLRRDAGFAVFAVLIAGLGIGASATVFSVVNTLLLRPLPFTKPSELVWIANRDVPGLSGQTTQVGYLLDLREKTQTMSAVAGYFAFYGVGDNLLSGRGEPERLSGVPVSDNFFDVLGVKPMLGRSFNAQESAWKGPKAVMLGHAIWERRFSRDPRIVGTSLVINDEPHLVVGVLPESFDFATVFAPGSRFDLYFPFPLSPETNRWGNTMAMIGRLKPGVTAARAHAEVTALAPQMRREHPERNNFTGVVRPLADQISGNIRLAVIVLAGAVGMVMLIVCANLSNLLLARTAARQKEIAIRMSLGAGRKRLLAQMLTEGLVLSSAGAVLGLGLAVLGTRLLTGLDSVSIPLLRDVRTDGAALAFTVVVTVIAGIVFGLAPALQTSGAGMSRALKDATRGSTEGRERTWIRNALVVSEIAFACVLLVGAGLLIRSLAAVLEVKMGFEPARSATLRVDPDGRVTTAEQRRAYLGEVLRRVGQAPGIEHAAITDSLPLGRNRTWGAGAKGVTYERGAYPLAFVRVVSEGYPAAMGVPLLAGRDLTASDGPGAEPVMLVNKTLADALWPGQNPIGQYINNGCGAKERRVVGVVGDVRHLSLEQPSGNEMYMPARQCDDLAGAYLVVRSSVPTAQLASTLRAALAPIAPNLAGNDFRTLQQIVDRSTSPRRFTVLLLGAFAVFALVLASLGIYALISYSVNQRRQEIGIRMALGASARDVQARILGQTLRLALIGLVIGAGASWLLARSASGLLFGVTARDPQTFVVMAAVLAMVALLAGYLPARRASRIDPMVALRAD